MNTFFLDASALAKRYVLEVGQKHVHALFDHVPTERLVTLTLVIGEVMSVIVRHRNRGNLTPDDARLAVAALLRETLDNPRFPKIEMVDSLVTPSFAYIDQHSLNTTDAVLLYAALLARDLGEDPVLVCSDTRLLRAARREKLAVLDPESASDEDVARLLAP